MIRRQNLPVIHKVHFRVLVKGEIILFGVNFIIGGIWSLAHDLAKVNHRNAGTMLRVSEKQHSHIPEGGRPFAVCPFSCPISPVQMINFIL